MPVLGAGLARVEDELLRAVAVGVHVDQHEQADLAQTREAEVRDLDRRPIGVGEHDAGRLELFCRVGLSLAQFPLRDHSTLPAPSTA